MNLLRNSLAAVLLSVTALTPFALSSAHAAEKAKVVLQVSDNDPAKWNLALNNANNVIAAVGPNNAEVEIVVYGPGIGMLMKDSPVGKRLEAAAGSGIQVVACENTMAGKKLSKSDMHASIGYVPAGVLEIIQRQSQGWGYVRP